MGSNVIKYGPDVLAALIRELDEPITSAITNPAPIEHGLVMTAEALLAEALLLAANQLKAIVACPRCGRDDLQLGQLPGHLPCLSATEGEDALAPVMGKPITSRITNSAPIERELVMDADAENRQVRVDAGLPIGKFNGEF